MKFVQARLKHENTEIICWIDSKKELKIGSKVKLKESDKQYTVLNLYGILELDEEYLKKMRKMNESFGNSIK